MIPHTPLTCYRDTPLCAPACNPLESKDFYNVWGGLDGNLFKRYPMDGDRMSERCQVVTNCHDVLGPFLNSVRNRARPHNFK